MPRTGPVLGVLAGLPTSDIDRGIAWLSVVLGEEPNARPMPVLADWYLGPAGTVQLVLDPDRAGGGLLTLQVDDITAVAGRLRAAGIAFEVDATSSERVAFGTATDPDGNAVTLVEAKPGFAPQGG